MKSLISSVSLIILDGWGLSNQVKGNAVAKANTPTMDYLMSAYPYTTLRASGKYVGLPEGQMGNSEVGHLNLGAGRIVYQDITRINKSIKEKKFFKNETLSNVMKKSKKLHLLGLLSEGRVHSSLDHLYALIKMAKENGVEKVFIHGFTDGRDTPPKCALKYIKEVENNVIKNNLGEIATISGRFYAMDRDNRWERIKLAFDAMVLGLGIKAKNAADAIKKAYERSETDEFIKPTVIVENSGKPKASIDDNDGVIIFNFRADRVREITCALTQKNFSFFKREKFPKVSFVGITEYDKTFNLPSAFPAEQLKNVLGEVVSKNSFKQLRTAETEKYAHVTYFFNGRREKPFLGEKRRLIPSPKVSTYDLIPEMSAGEVTDAFIEETEQTDFAFRLLNYANPDMVGHTGNLNATIKAVETVDKCLGRLIKTIQKQHGIAIVVADHGNAEQMIDYETGEPHTAHTTNLVPFIITLNGIKLQEGILADVAPTILKLLCIKQPREMTGKILILL